MKDFKFNKEGHYYELDGKRMYGVTTVLGVIAKPALIPWAVKTCVDYIKNNCKQDELMRYLVHNMDLDEAKSAHRKKKEDAGEKGTDAHSMAEGYVKECMETNQGLALELKSANEQVQHFIDWAVKNEVIFRASEKQVCNEGLWYAGTADLVIEIKGKKYIGDIKTSSAIYPEHFYQMAAYRLALESMGEEGFDGSVVIRLGKDNKFKEEKDVQYRYDFETDKAAFLGALAIFKAGETYKCK